MKYNTQNERRHLTTRMSSTDWLTEIKIGEVVVNKNLSVREWEWESTSVCIS